MATYVQYQLDDGGLLLVEVDDNSNKDIVKASRQEDGNIIVKAGEKFREAIQSAKTSAAQLVEELSELPMDEIEITFGLKSIGEAGIFAVGKVGVEANYEVKLKWKRQNNK